MKRIFIFLIAASIFLPACSSTKWVRTPIVKEKDFTLTLEQHQVEGDIVDQTYDHPYEIETSRLLKLLSDLTYMEQVGILGRETKSHVFQATEIEQLAPALANTLATIDDSQRIRFISYNRGKGLIFSTSRETEGVIFIKPDNHFNIAFSLINSEIDLMETTAYPPVFSNIDPLKRKIANTTVFPPAYAENHTFETGKQAPMWIVANLEKLNQAIRDKADHSVQKEKATTPAATTGPAIANPPVEKTAPAPATPENTQLHDDIKTKLKYLKELLDEGLIKEQDYNAKKNELLDKL